jgi:hypothetical protein
MGWNELANWQLTNAKFRQIGISDDIKICRQNRNNYVIDLFPVLMLIPVSVL